MLLQISELLDRASSTISFGTGVEHTGWLLNMLAWRFCRPGRPRAAGQACRAAPGRARKAEPPPCCSIHQAAGPKLTAWHQVERWIQTGRALILAYLLYLHSVQYGSLAPAQLKYCQYAHAAWQHHILTAAGALFDKPSIVFLSLASTWYMLKRVYCAAHACLTWVCSCHSRQAAHAGITGPADSNKLKPAAKAGHSTGSSTESTAAVAAAAAEQCTAGSASSQAGC